MIGILFCLAIVVLAFQCAYSASHSDSMLETIVLGVSSVLLVMFAAWGLTNV